MLSLSAACKMVAFVSTETVLSSIVKLIILVPRHQNYFVALQTAIGFLDGLFLGKNLLYFIEVVEKDIAIDHAGMLSFTGIVIGIIKLMLKEFLMERFEDLFLFIADSGLSIEIHDSTDGSSLT